MALALTLSSRRCFANTIKTIQTTTNPKRSFSSTAAAAAAAATTTGKKEAKTPGDIFLDNLGSIFLSAIALVILSLVRSAKGTTAKTNLRTHIENSAALDPFEIDDLRVANSELDRRVFEEIMQKAASEIGEDGKISYQDFVNVVMAIMKDVKGEAFTIQLGHLLDRVVISCVQRRTDGDERIDSRLLWVALSLAMNSDVRDRVETLFQVMQGDAQAQTQTQTQMSETSTSDEDRQQSSSFLTDDQVVQMVGFLQQTNQLVPDSQIVEGETKYPIQEYRIGTPLELVAIGKSMVKDDLSEAALDPDVNQRRWSCDDLHHVLRSRSVCAWGECYVKKKGL